VRVLLTGYEPFHHWTVNSSGEIVKVLAEEPPEGMALRTRILPVVFGDAGSLLAAEIDAFDPEIILSLGAGIMSCLRVERVGLNLCDIPGRQDNRGQSPEEEPIDPSGPAAYFATIPVRPLTKYLCSHGIPAVESLSAGAYLCNNALYTALHHCARTGRNTWVGFIHVPLLPEQAATEPVREKPASLALTTQVTGIRLALDFLVGARREARLSVEKAGAAP